jgi:hypothetical protein
MGLPYYLSNPVITINSVDSPISAQVQLLTMFKSNLKPQHLATLHASTARQQSHHCKTTALRLSYTKVMRQAKRRPRFWFGWHHNNVVVAPASGAASATNPIYTLTGCYLESHTPINASLGELSNDFDILLVASYKSSRHDRAALAAEN